MRGPAILSRSFRGPEYATGAMGSRVLSCSPRSFSTSCRTVAMARTFKFAGAVALAAVAACSSDSTAPSLQSPDLTLGSSPASSSSSSSHTVIVTESDVSRQVEDTPPLRSWVFYTRSPTSTGAFITGPGNPPLGVGSFQMGTVLATDKGTLFNYDHVGTPLTNITAVRYATYRDPASTAPAVQLPSVNIEVDYNGPAVAGDIHLSVRPVYQPAPAQLPVPARMPFSPASGKLDGIPGIWWSTGPINGCAAHRATNSGVILSRPIPMPRSSEDSA